MRIFGGADSTSEPLAERLRRTLDRSIRRECLNHFIILNARHLKRTLAAYFRYYHQSRPHLALEKQLPNRASDYEARRDRRKFQNSAASTIVTNVSQREIEIGRINGERHANHQLPPDRPTFFPAAF